MIKFIVRIVRWISFKWDILTGKYKLGPTEYMGKISIRKDVEVIPNPNHSEFTMKQVGGIEKLSLNVYSLGTFELYKDGKQINFHGIPMPQMKMKDKENK